MSHYTHLSMSDRRRLFILLEMGLPMTGIAKRLGRSRATLYRELKRNQESGSYSPGIAQFWQLKSAKLITSNYALEEAKRNLPNPNQRKRLNELIKAVDMHTEYDEALIPDTVTLRAKDRPILAAAIGAQANYLITGDVRDFGCFYGKRVAGILTLPPSDYLKRR